MKILRYKYIAGLNAYKPVETKGLSKRLNSPHAAWMAAKLNSEAITVLKNEDTILPLKQLNKKKIAALSIGWANMIRSLALASDGVLRLPKSSRFIINCKNTT